MGSLISHALTFAAGILVRSITDAQSPPVPEDINVTGTSFLDYERPIGDFFGKTFLRENIPYIDIPDSTIEEMYYCRWSTLQRHLRYSIAGSGYIFLAIVSSCKGNRELGRMLTHETIHHCQQTDAPRDAIGGRNRRRPQDP